MSPWLGAGSRQGRYPAPRVTARNVTRRMHGFQPESVPVHGLSHRSGESRVVASTAGEAASQPAQRVYLSRLPLAQRSGSGLRPRPGTDDRLCATWPRRCPATGRYRNGHSAQGRFSKSLQVALPKTGLLLRAGKRRRSPRSETVAAHNPTRERRRRYSGAVPWTCSRRSAYRQSWRTVPPLVSRASFVSIIS